MKTNSFLSKCGYVCAAAVLTASLTAVNAPAQTRGTDVKGADVRGGDVRGGNVTGGSVTGGSVTGGSVSGGSVTPGMVTPGTVTAFADGREIRVRATGSVNVNVNGSTAEVKLNDQMLMIEKSRVTLDGKEIGTVPENSKKVQVDVTEGRLSVKSDGKEVAKGNLK